MNTVYPENWPQFFTASIKDLRPLRANDIYKDIIVDALRYAVAEKRIRLSAFVIMINHIHIVWQQLPPFTKTQVQLGFMKYTAQKIKFQLQQHDPKIPEEYKVNKADRVYQIWKRRPLSIDLPSESMFFQKIDYIHNNPVKAGICKCAEEYKYSSAKFYEKGIDEFGIFKVEARRHFSGNPILALLWLVSIKHKILGWKLLI